MEYKQLTKYEDAAGKVIKQFMLVTFDNSQAILMFEDGTYILLEADEGILDIVHWNISVKDLISPRALFSGPDIVLLGFRTQEEQDVIELEAQKKRNDEERDRDIVNMFSAAERWGYAVVKKDV